ncbi:MAG: EAL domain-containing protein [Gammaproteobacteria bacterium]|nr:EAL domain-containing protein [Gammaproteobacteria bacterium]
MPSTGKSTGIAWRLSLLFVLALIPVLLFVAYVYWIPSSSQTPPLNILWIAVVGLLLLARSADRRLLQPMRALQRTRAALSESDARYQRLVDSSRDVIYRYQFLPERGFTFISPTVASMIGYTPEEICADPNLAATLLYPDDRAQLDEIAAGRAPPVVELRWLHKNGAVVWTEQRYAHVLDQRGQRVAIEGVMRDITPQKQLADELQLLHTISVAVNDAKDLGSALAMALRAICQTTGWAIGQAWLPNADGSRLECSPAWYSGAPGLETFHSTCESWNVELNGAGLLARAAREHLPLWCRDLSGQRDFRRATYAAADGLQAAIVVPVYSGNALEAVIEFFMRQVRPEDEYLVRTVSSMAPQLAAVVRRKRSEERLAYLAQHDSLTGLPNRALFADRLRQAIFQASRHSRQVAVAFLDIDRFKTINESLGHEAGDLLLRAMAERLRHCLRDGDTVGRTSGDEFTLILADMAQVDDAARLAHKILTSLRRPFELLGQEIYVSASLGLTLYPHDSQDVEELLRNADVAMYRAKEIGRNTYQFYAAEMTAHAQDRLSLENALRRALDRGEFTLHYQPIVELNGGNVIGAEALLRWRHPERGMVPPLQFIPLAEETGLIVPIGEWVLRTACAQCKEWDSNGLGALTLAVNISPRQFQRPDFASTVAKVLRETGLPPERLELELTESVLMHNPETTIANMKRLSDIGVQLSIDDFGTGYSSLSYLKRFPIDRLKIDRSFVKGIPADGDDAAIATAIIAMAHKLQLNVIAEGVETADQLAYLRSHECDVMQGYYFSPPIPNDEYVKLLSARPRLTMPPLVTETNGPH